MSRSFDSARGKNGDEAFSWCAGLLYVLVMLVFLPTILFPFVTVDDPAYVYENPNVYTGISWANVVWAFTALHGNISYWHPLTWLSHQLDCQLFGFNAGPQHLTNVLLHAANSILLLAFARKLGLGILASLLVAAVFAVHPLHVESVAWVSERKDVLCGVFYLSSLNLYLDFCRQGRRRLYLGSLICGLLALMAKPVAVTLPAVLLLLHWHLGGYRNPLPNRHVLRQWWPFLLGGLAVAVITLIAQQRVGTLGTLAALPVAERLDNMWLAYLAYVRRFFWPTDLCVSYGFDPSIGRYGIIALLALMTITFLAWRFRQKLALGLFGWLLFLVMLFPTIGLVQTGPQSSADRYMYLPLIGLSLFTVDLFRGLRRSPEVSWFWKAAGAAACVALSMASMIQVICWRDSVTLFSRAVAVQPNFWFARLGLGTALTSAGRFDEALAHLQFALELPGNASETHRILGVCLFGKRRYAEALENFRRSYDLKSTPSATLMLAHLYSGQDDPSLRDGAQAMRFALEALRKIPEPDGKAFLAVAAAHAANGHSDKAIYYAERALEMARRNGDSPIIHEAQARLRAYRYLSEQAVAQLKGSERN
ncbi:MAG: tetratricopeptide repeat protein [Verrucomicrobiales bacterium]|nr:tetratricopeptide repeat protein [Verrucomicrobiales bacterium]